MAKFLTEIQFVATGSMDTPDGGLVALYMNTDGYLYVKFADGSQTRLTS
jgi:hypothetical protein